MNAKETANRHGQYVVAGNMQAVAADFKPEALQEFMKLRVGPPRGTNAFEVLSERQEGDRHVFDIRYSNGEQSVTIRSNWEQIGDDWKIVYAEPVT